MAVTITLGWWLAPLVLTLAAFAWAIPIREDERPRGGMFDGLGYAIGGGFRILGALSFSLLCWLIWALLT